MSDWQPIETAPRDGTVILYRNSNVSVGVCRWWSAEDIAAHEGGTPDEYQAGWYNADDNMDEVCPSEWMQTPFALSKANGEGGDQP